MSRAQVPRVSVVLVLDGDGRRICGKYHGERYETAEQQAEFEKSIFSKTRMSTARAEGTDRAAGGILL